MMSRTYKVIFEEQEYEVELQPSEQGYELKLGETSHRFEVLHRTATSYSFLIDGGHVLEADVALQQDRCELNVANVPYHLEVFDPKRRILSQSEAGSSSGLVAAPMPGKIVDVKVKVGDVVEKGQAVLVIEAMKMQNELNAAVAGVVQEIAVSIGQSVEADQKLVMIAAQSPR